MISAIRKAIDTIRPAKERRLKSIIIPVAVVVAGMLVCSCGKKEEQEIGKLAVGYVESLYGGDFNGAVSHTAGANEASSQYREHLALLYQNMVGSNLVAHGALTKTECYRVKEDKEHHYADAYVRLTFADSTRQDILLPMEEHSGQWMVK